MPTESKGSNAATRLFPVSFIAFICLGAIYPAAPINAKFFIIFELDYFLKDIDPLAQGTLLGLRC